MRYSAILVVWRILAEINRLHPLVSVVVIALMAVIAGAGGPTGTARRALLNEN
jgi:hypothetical protein